MYLELLSKVLLRGSIAPWSKSKVALRKRLVGKNLGKTGLDVYMCMYVCVYVVALRKRLVGKDLGKTSLDALYMCVSMYVYVCMVCV